MELNRSYNLFSASATSLLHSTPNARPMRATVSIVGMRRLVRRHRGHGLGHFPPSRSNASAVRDKVSGLLACHFLSRNLPSIFSAQTIRCICTTRNKPGWSRRSNSRSASVTDWSPFKWQTATHCFFLPRHSSIVKYPCAINQYPHDALHYCLADSASDLSASSRISSRVSARSLARASIFAWSFWI